MQVCVESAAAGTDAVDRGGPEHVAEHDRCQCAVEERAPGESGWASPVLPGQPGDGGHAEQEAPDQAAVCADDQRRVSFHHGHDRHRVDREAERGGEGEQDPADARPQSAAGTGRDERDTGERDPRRQPVPPPEALETGELRHQRYEDRKGSEHERNRRGRREVDCVAECDLVEEDADDRRQREQHEFVPPQPEGLPTQQNDCRERDAGNRPAKRHVDKRLEPVRDAVAESGEVEAPQQHGGEQKALGRHPAHAREHMHGESRAGRAVSGPASSPTKVLRGLPAVMVAARERRIRR